MWVKSYLFFEGLCDFGGQVDQMVIGGIKLVAFLQDRAVRSAAFEDNSRNAIWTIGFVGDKREQRNKPCEWKIF